MNYYVYTPITDHPIVLDLTDCRDWGDLHQRIRKTFGFPAYYGENWDAMWDCLREVFLLERDRCAIIVKGFITMDAALQNYCQSMRELFADLQHDYPGITVTYL